MRLTRRNAAAWGIDPARVGVLGFSAGGHLASTISVHYDVGDGNAAASLDRINSRPDVSILLYPVITLTTASAHSGSRANLLEEPDNPQLLELLSTERHVTAQTPPMFVFHTVDDSVVPVENVLLLAGALRKAQVPVEMHLYETGRHGVGLATDNPALRTWTDLCAQWLRSRNFAR
jgi:acetyl esterase/lipase